MGRTKALIPERRYHVSGQSVVTIDGKNFYLGPHNESLTIARYACLIKAYQENGYRLPDEYSIEDVRNAAEGHFGDLMASKQDDQPALVKHLAESYRAWVLKRYADSEQDRERRTQIVDWLLEHDANLPIEKFGPKKLREYRDRLDDGRRSRRYLNRLTNEIRSVFKWGVSEELVPANVLVGLKSLSPLVAGEGGFERAKRKPVPIDHVRATAKHLTPIVRDMLTVQLATGMRPSEVCSMRPMDIDRSGEVWLYKPVDHKTAWKGIEREIPLLGEARTAVENYLNRKFDAFLFSPKESMAWHRAKLRSERTGYGSYKKPKERPQKEPGEQYDSGSYRQAIERAAKAAKVPHWTPYMVRHLVGTTVTEALQLESTKALLGHCDLATTQIYAKATTRTAIEAAKHAPTMGGDK
jgi:integrase